MLCNLDYHSRSHLQSVMQLIHLQFLFDTSIIITELSSFPFVRYIIYTFILLRYILFHLSSVFFSCFLLLVFNLLYCKKVQQWA